MGVIKVATAWVFQFRVLAMAAAVIIPHLSSTRRIRLIILQPQAHLRAGSLPHRLLRRLSTRRRRCRRRHCKVRPHCFIRVKWALPSAVGPPRVDRDRHRLSLFHWRRICIRLTITTTTITTFINSSSSSNSSTSLPHHHPLTQAPHLMLLNLRVAMETGGQEVTATTICFILTIALLHRPTCLMQRRRQQRRRLRLDLIRSIVRAKIYRPHFSRGPQL
jgi:hypothetical protein